MKLNFYKSIFSISILLILFGFASTSLAGNWSPSKEWGEQNASYSPDWGNTAMYEYIDSNGQLKISPQARFKFTDSAINNIHLYHLYDDLEYTFDVSVTNENNTSVDAFWYYYTNLPNAKFDIDDDPESITGGGGNGYNDETEVVVLNPKGLAANTDYRFQSYFKVFNKNTTYFQFGSQMSEYWPVYDEYNAKHISPHINRKYPW